MQAAYKMAMITQFLQLFCRKGVVNMSMLCNRVVATIFQHNVVVQYVDL
jgi:hypothetical protein